MASPCGHCRLTEEDSLLNEIITASIPLPKYLPRYPAENQRQASPEQIQTVSHLVRRYTEAGYNLSSEILGENILHFVLKYMLDADLIPLLLARGADYDTDDYDGFTPIKVALWNLPASKQIVSVLLEQGAPVFIEQEDEDKNALFLLCSRAPDERTAALIHGLFAREDIWAYCEEDHQPLIMYEAVHKAIEHHAPVCVLQALMDHGGLHHYGPSGVRMSTVGRAVQEGQPDALAYLLSRGALTWGKACEMNPLFNCVRLAKQSCGIGESLPDAATNAHFLCLVVLLAQGAMVNESVDERLDPMHKYWSFPESRDRGFRKPKSGFLSPFVALYDIATHRRRNLSSYAYSPIFPNAYMMVMVFDMLIDAGAVPHRGEIPHDIIELLFQTYAQTEDETLQEALAALWDRMLAAGFDGHAEGFSYSLVQFQRSHDPAWQIPPPLEDALLRFEQARYNPRPLALLANVRFRATLALYDDERTLPFSRRVELLDTSTVLKNIIRLAGTPSAARVLRDRAAEMAKVMEVVNVEDEDNN